MVLGLESEPTKPGGDKGWLRHPPLIVRPFPAGRNAPDAGGDKAEADPAGGMDQGKALPDRDSACQTERGFRQAPEQRPLDPGIACMTAPAGAIPMLPSVASANRLHPDHRFSNCILRVLSAASASAWSNRVVHWAAGIIGKSGRVRICHTVQARSAYWSGSCHALLHISLSCFDKRSW